jgi:hypothetical protein
MAWQVGDLCTLEDLKRELRMNPANTTDDQLLEDLIHDISSEVERFTNRHFYARAETRYFHALNDTDINRLLLDADLISVTQITLGSGAVLDADDFVLEPYNYSPHVSIALKRSSGKAWQQFQVDPERAIVVEGSWGFVDGTLPPADVKRAAIKFARWRYLEVRSNPVTEQSGMGGVGEFNVTSSIPQDVQRMLNPYRRKLIFAVQRDWYW